MNHADALEVLAVAAAFDRRTVGEADGMAWSLALPTTGIEEAKNAVIRHYQRTESWVMPSHVLAIVAEMNRARSRDLPPVVPPRELADDPRQEAEWTRAWGDAVLAGHTEESARILANRKFGIEDHEPLALEASEVEARLEGFRQEFIKAKTTAPGLGPARRLPAAWAAGHGLMILDADGWREAGKDVRASCTEAKYDELIVGCTTGPFQRRTEPLPMPPVGLSEHVSTEQEESK